MEDSALENELPVHVVSVFAMSDRGVSLADRGARTIWYWYQHNRQIDNDRATLY